MSDKTALPVAILEFFGGILLIIGLIVPIVSALLFIEMLGTIWLHKVKMKHVFLSGGAKGHYELDVAYAIIAIVLVILGAGLISVDGLLAI